MASEVVGYTTKELSKKTWPDFERLFSQGNGFDYCWCMHFQRARLLSSSEKPRIRAEKSIRNRREKRELVEKGCAHGILVYAHEEPVGWCQYGRKDELPRIDASRKYQQITEGAPERLWRITCFAVVKKYRRRGVASAALTAALEAIRNKGGGLVEAYPIMSWETRAFGNESTHGTASMFEKEGFKPVAPFGTTRFSTHVLMRITV